ncbi:ATP-binding protein [Kozakia baliensis]|nr:ATP-binding protein [Kozakia baliensis]GBR31115.1 two component sensor histidine kinase [Kozakia baliensis NRIC 0488]GEL62922.1 hypothetical protein KBA01_02080 [Kozakia baliensis]
MIHALDHLDIAERAELHENEHRAFSIYRSIVETPKELRHDALDDISIPSNFDVSFSAHPDTRYPSIPIPVPLAILNSIAHGPPHRPNDIPPFPPHEDGGLEGEHFEHPGEPPLGGLGPAGPFPGSGPSDDRRMIPGELPPLLHMSMLPPKLYPHRIVFSHQPNSRRYAMSLLLPDEQSWVVLDFRVPPPNPFGSPTFIISFLLMTVCGGALILWGTQRLIAPVSTLANAAEALGRDVHAPPLPEKGPTEIRRSALAFNTMAARIRRFVSDRTLMLTAIGHDLRTPITRLKLRAEFIEDDELREKFLADLDEMENMVAATLAFGRDSSSREPMVSLELNALLQTIADEATESRPDLADDIAFDPPEKPVRIKARSLALKRALTNLVMNALKYGNSAHITLTPPTANGRERYVRVVIEDHGPGLPPEDLERMFEPFVRAETSRNRETGGTGLGLAIARSIIRAQGGDVHLRNRAEGGLRAVVTLLV